MRKIVVLVLGLAVGACVFVFAQQPAPDPDALPRGPKALPIPPGRQVFYDLDIKPGLDRRKVVLGESVTFNMAELTPKPMTDPVPQGHHHDYEQILFGLEGVYNQSAGPETCRVSNMTACLEPPNVPHSVTGFPSQEKVLTIEFLPLARKDLVPPRPKIDYPKSAQPMPIPDGMQVFADFNKMSWVGEPGRPRFKALIGKTCSLMLWHFPAATMRGTAEPGHHHTVEQITYILEGHAEMRVGDQVRPVGPGTLIMIPSEVEHLPMKAVNNEDIVLLDFQPAVRRDILRRMGKS